MELTLPEFSLFTGQVIFCPRFLSQVLACSTDGNSVAQRSKGLLKVTQLLSRTARDAEPGTSMSEIGPSLNLLPSAPAASGPAWGAIFQSLGRNRNGDKWVKASGSSRVVRLLPPQAPLEEEETAAHSSGYRKERSWGRKRPLCAVQSGGRELLSQDTQLCPGPHPGSGSLVLEVGLVLCLALLEFRIFSSGHS